MSALTDAMKVDLAGVFAYDIQRTAIIIENGITTTYTVLLDDSQEDEQDDFGGPMIDMGQGVHFLISDLSSIEPGATIYIQDVDNSGPPGTKINRKKLVISTTTSADGNELIVKVKGA